MRNLNVKQLFSLHFDITRGMAAYGGSARLPPMVAAAKGKNLEMDRISEFLCQVLTKSVHASRSNSRKCTIARVVIIESRRKKFAHP